MQEPGGGQEPAPEASPPSPRQDQDALVAAINALTPRYRQWVRSVIGLMSQAELDYFLALGADYRRDAFMEAFWSVRDPDPRTPVNELRRRWAEFRNSQGGLPYGDPRFLLYLLNGPPGRYNLPDGRPVARCFSRSKELEIWFYGGSERTLRRFIIIFTKQGVNSPYEVYRLGGVLRPVQRSGGRLPTTNVRLLCAEEFLNFALREISLMGNYERLLEEVLTPRLPSPEWLATFSASTTDLPEGAETFAVDLDLRFPGRNQSRTAVQVMLGVSRQEAPGQSFDGELFHNFLLTGEVLRDGDLFESFRYGFEGPTPEGATEIPLGFTRYLRPGTVTLRLLLKDVFSDRFAQVVRQIEVPSPQGLPSVRAAVTQPGDLDTGEDPSRPSVRLVPPPGNVHSGMVRFRARTVGEFDRVTFYLDDKQVFSKGRPPYSVELDLGSAPAPRRVRVVGLLRGEEVATDQVWLNQGAQRFRVRMIEPRPGGIYPGSLTARVEVTTPDGNPPERVELWVNDEQVTTLVGGPSYSHSLRLPGAQVAAIRVVAYLADGSSSEDVVVVNAAGFVEEVQVQLVEIRALVTDAQGRRIPGLTVEQFRVLEDGTPQEIRRFEESSTAPIHAALVIDRSSSMEPHLDRVTDAAQAFARAALASPEDRIAVLSFADETSVDTGFTANSAQIERALASLNAFGGTTLYDSLAQAFNFFDGVQGHTALVVFSDGRDEGSRLTFEQTLETARRLGVTLYTVGLEQAFSDKDTRRVLEELAAETGGQAHFVAGLDQIDEVYAGILEELRSRYLLAYQSSSSREPAEFRTLRVEVDHRGARVRARRGYYP